jgi:cytochrome c biogenesis protein CcmG/thiol:disulfide interchange protein DsbE
MSRRSLQTTIAVLAAVVALVVVLVVGLRQAPETRTATGGEDHPLDAQTVQAKLAGAPPALAALHASANVLLPGGSEELDHQLAAVKGHPAVVNLWAAWCGPCIVELPLLQQASLDYGRRIAFLGVDFKDDRARAERLLRRIPMTYPSVEDPDGRIFESYHLVGTPSTVFYDASGKQTFVHQGPYQDRKSLEDDLQRYALGA